MSNPKSPIPYPFGATSRPPAGSAQEPVGSYPGPDQAPDARGHSPRMNSRTAALDAHADACGHLPQKITRTPAPPQGRSRRGRRDPQNRDGSRGPGFAEGSLPRLAPGGQGFEQEIPLLRSLIDRLLSRRPLNHAYISRYMRLLIQAISAANRIPREPTDQEQIDSLIKKVFHKTVDEGEISFFDLLPVRKAHPGDKWWPWRHLVPLRTRREYGLIDLQDPWPHEDEECFATMDALDKAESGFLDDLFDDDDPDDPDNFTEDPDDTDPFPSDPDDYLPPPNQDEESSHPAQNPPPADSLLSPDPDPPHNEEAPSSDDASPRAFPLPEQCSPLSGWPAPFSPPHPKSPRTARGRPRPP